MTRPSKRELERALEELDDADDNALRILVEETIVGTEWSGDDGDETLDAGETRTETSELILGGDS